MAKVTSKGQVTIPIAVREALEIESGDEVLFELEPGGAKVRVRKQARLADLYRSLPTAREYPGRHEERTAAGQALGQWLGRRTPDNG